MTNLLPRTFAGDPARRREHEFLVPASQWPLRRATADVLHQRECHDALSLMRTGQTVESEMDYVNARRAVPRQTRASDAADIAQFRQGISATREMVTQELGAR